MQLLLHQFHNKKDNDNDNNNDNSDNDNNNNHNNINDNGNDDINNNPVAYGIYESDSHSQIQQRQHGHPVENT